MDVQSSVKLARFQASLRLDAWCYHCGYWHPRDHFRSVRDRYDSRSPWCKATEHRRALGLIGTILGPELKQDDDHPPKRRRPRRRRNRKRSKKHGRTTP